MLGSDEEVKTQIPTQAQSIVEGSGAVMVSEYKPAPDVDYIQVFFMGSKGKEFYAWFLFKPPQ